MGAHSLLSVAILEVLQQTAVLKTCSLVEDLEQEHSGWVAGGVGWGEREDFLTVEENK